MKYELTRTHPKLKGTSKDNDQTNKNKTCTRKRRVTKKKGLQSAIAGGHRFCASATAIYSCASDRDKQ